MTPARAHGTMPRHSHRPPTGRPHAPPLHQAHRLNRTPPSATCSTDRTIPPGSSRASIAHDAPRQGQPKTMVPAITMLVDSHEHLPYKFESLVRIAGTIRQTLPAGDYAIAEAPEIFCVERRRVEEFNTIFSNPSDNRSPFLQETRTAPGLPTSVSRHRRNASVHQRRRAARPIS